MKNTDQNKKHGMILVDTKRTYKRGIFMPNLIAQQNRQALAYAEKVAPLIANISEPLLKNFNLTIFSYIKLLPNNTTMLLTSDPKWFRIYFEGNLYNENDRFYHECASLQENETKSFILTGIPRDKHCSYLYEYGVWHNYSFYRKINNIIEGWAFGTLRENAQVLELYLNNPEILTHFIQYFNSKAGDMISSQENKLITLDRKESLSQYRKRNMQNYLEKISISHLPVRIGEKDIRLTLKELTCLDYLARGLSMKEIARVMKISPRTVETYLNKIKNKTNYHGKEGLVGFFHENVVHWI